MRTDILNPAAPISRFPTSHSTPSIDKTCLVESYRFTTLLSETLSLSNISVSSNSTTFTAPPIPPRALARLSMVGFADHLQLFHRPAKRTSRTESEPSEPFLVSSPTSPRLKALAKERLSIVKWRESLTGHQLPGHSPWRQQQNKSTPLWVPDGSLFCPEEFASLLASKRIHSSPGSRSIPRTNVRRPVIHPSTSDHIVPVDSAHSLRLTMNVSFIEMVQELNDLKTFFQHTRQVEETRSRSQAKKTATTKPATNAIDRTPSIPSRPKPTSAPPKNPRTPSKVQNTSHGTLSARRGTVDPPRPMGKARQSSSNQKGSSKPSPPAVIPKKRETPCVPSDSSSKSIGVEDMIHNLRQKCSAMSLNVSVADSAPPTGEPGPAAATMAIVEKADLAKAHLRQESEITAQSSPQTQSIVSKGPSSPTGALSTTAADRVTHQHLRSAFATVGSVPKPTKTVRFALSRTEFEKAIAAPPVSPPIDKLEGSRSRLPRRELHTQRHVSVSPGGKAKSPSVSERKPNLLSNLKASPKSIEDVPDQSVSSSSDTSGRVLERETTGTAVIIPLSGFQLSSIPTTSTTDDDKTPDPRPRRSAGSLSRHSLSRIMKGPIFGTKDPSKRLTFSGLRNEHAMDENSVRQSSKQHDDGLTSKKSRVPVPLRGILGRFR